MQKLRTKPARRWNSPHEHNSYGIVNWFKSKGIISQDVMKETMYAFCVANEFKDLSTKTPLHTIENFVGNRFNKFASFAMKYLRENNYINQ